MLQGQNRCSEPSLVCASWHGDGAGRSQGGSFQKRLFCLQSSCLWCKEILISKHLGAGLRCELLVWAPFTAKSCSWFLIGWLRASPLTCAHSVRLLFFANVPVFSSSCGVWSLPRLRGPRGAHAVRATLPGSGPCHGGQHRAAGPACGSGAAGEAGQVKVGLHPQLSPCFLSNLLVTDISDLDFFFFCL